MRSRGQGSNWCYLRSVGEVCCVRLGHPHTTFLLLLGDKNRWSSDWGSSCRRVRWNSRITRVQLADVQPPSLGLKRAHARAHHTSISQKALISAAQSEWSLPLHRANGQTVWISWTVGYSRMVGHNMNTCASTYAVTEIHETIPGPHKFCCACALQRCPRPNTMHLALPCLRGT